MAMMAEPGTSDKAPSVTVIRPTRGWLRIDLAELFTFRELALFFVWRDLKVRYRQTALGALWALLQPLLLMLMFTLIFSVIAKIPSEGLPYPVFVYAGLLPWQLFAYALTEASGSVVANERLITKVYFPRLLIPLSSVLAGIIDFAISLGLLLVLMVVFRVPPTPWLIVVPAFAILALAAALGVGTWLAALNVQFRDVRYTLPFLTQLWLLATPIVYSSTAIPEPWRTVAALNPMAGVVEGFRWALIGTTPPRPELLALSAVAAVVVLVSGLLYFRRMERTFADVI